MKTVLRCSVFLIGLIGSFDVAFGQERDMAARQVVALFEQACVAQFGDVAKVTGWLETRHVPHASEALAIALLKGRPGTAYDASNSTGKYALTVDGNGVCTVFAPQAKAADLIVELDSALKNLHLTTYLLDDHPDKSDARVRHRDYLVVHGGVNYDLVASTAEGSNLQAILSFWNRGTNEPIPSPLPSPQ
jgi:hypothetical protein